MRIIVQQLNRHLHSETVENVKTNDLFFSISVFVEYYYVPIYLFLVACICLSTLDYRRTDSVEVPCTSHVRYEFVDSTVVVVRVRITDSAKLNVTQTKLPETIHHYLLLSLPARIEQYTSTGEATLPQSTAEEYLICVYPCVIAHRQASVVIL